MCVLLFKILLVVCGYFYAWTSMCCSNTASSFKSVKVCNTLKNSYIFLSWHLFYPFPSVPSVLMWPVCVMTSRFGEFRRASGILVPCPCDVTLSPVKYEWFRCTALFFLALLSSCGAAGAPSAVRWRLSGVRDCFLDVSCLANSCSG